MNGPDARARAREARRRLQAQRRRAGELRARAVVISVVAFALLWGVVFMQMATGHDPVLGGLPKATASGRGEARSGPAEGVEPEPVEVEVVEPEPEPEPEPAPVITGQS